MSVKVRVIEAKLPSLSESERVLACCMIVREKIEAGDYEAACLRFSHGGPMEAGQCKSH